MTEIKPGRRVGNTTRQMQEAPRNAVFIWITSATLPYAKSLAHELGRDDLEIIPPHLIESRLRGRTVSGVVVDHAANLDHWQWRMVDWSRARVS